MVAASAYCGSPPAPAELLGRFNDDPILILVLAAIAVAIAMLGTGFMLHRRRAFYGWLVAAFALISPLCALSVSLFAARVAQHMLLLLVAAPLLASAIFRRSPSSVGLWASAAAFFLALWFWHMPVPYDATFRSTLLYWAMHLTLFGSGIWMWCELLGHAERYTAHALAATLFTSTQMGLLGAVLTLAGRPLFTAHLATTAAWGLTPLEDQQLGGIIMWVPGIALFLWAALRSLTLLWRALEAPRPA
jgi:putative membrane protein